MADNQGLESKGFTLPETEQYLQETYPSYAQMSPQDRQAYLQEMHYGPAQEKQGSGLGAAVKEDVVGAVKGLPTALIPGAIPFQHMKADIEAHGRSGMSAQGEEDAARKAAGYSLPYRALAPIAEGVGVNVPGMEASAAKGDTEGVLGHTVVPTAMAVSPIAAEGVKPVARVAGAAMENTGKFANTRIGTGIGTSRFQEVTPAGVLGMGIGGFAGHRLGIPGGELGGALAGATAASAAARGLESGGRALREFGGYEAPPIPLSERTKVPTRPPRLNWSTAKNTAKMAKEAGDSAPARRIVIPGEAPESRIVKSGKSYEAADPSGGSLMMRSNEEIKKMYDAAKSIGAPIDPDLSNAMVKRGLLPVGNYSRVPYPTQ